MQVISKKKSQVLFMQILFIYQCKILVDQTIKKFVYFSTCAWILQYLFFSSNGDYDIL